MQCEFSWQLLPRCFSALRRPGDPFFGSFLAALAAPARMELLANPLQRSNPLLQVYKSAVRFAPIASDFQLGSHVHVWFRTLTQFSRNPLELQGTLRTFRKNVELRSRASAAREAPGALESAGESERGATAEKKETENVTNVADEYRGRFGAGLAPGEAKPHVLILLFLCATDGRAGRGGSSAAETIRSDPKATEALEPSLRSASLVCFHFRANLVPCFSFPQAALALQECKRFMETPTAVFSLRARAPDNLQALSDLFGAIPGMTKPKIIELCKNYPTFRELCRASKGYLDAGISASGRKGQKEAKARKERKERKEQPGEQARQAGPVPKLELEELPNFGKTSAMKLAATLFGATTQAPGKNSHPDKGVRPIMEAMKKASSPTSAEERGEAQSEKPTRPPSRRKLPALELESVTPADAFLDVDIDFDNIREAERTGRDGV